MSKSTRAIGGTLIVLLVVLALITGVVWLTSRDTDNGRSAAASISGPSGSPSAAAGDINAKAAEWVRQLVVNFRGIDSIPQKCRNWTPKVDLTEVHFYNEATNKESNTAFGPSMGTTPCEISINIVERSYRDPMLLLDLAKRRGIVKFAAANMADKVIQLENASFEEREQLADKVLGWYANSDRVLTVGKHKGSYRSNVVATSNGTRVTRGVHSSKASDVLVATNRKTGKTESMDRLNCGLQDFVPGKPEKPHKPGKPGKPEKPHHPGKPKCPSGQHGRPPVCKDGTAQGPAHNSKLPNQQKPNPLPAKPEHKQHSKPKNPPEIYHSPAPAKPKPTPRPTPAASPGPGAPAPSEAPDTCVPAPGKTTCP